MPTRRVFLTAAAGVPLAAKAMTRAELPTPALLLDLDAFNANVERMAGFLKKQGRAFRPHAKTHKCPEIARRLIEAGAVGACAAKISEAEALAGGGVTGLLLTSAMVGRWRIERAVRLARRHPETIFSVDDAANARDLNDAAGAARLKLNLAIDLLVGNRTGIEPGERAAELARLIVKLPNLKLAGLQSYSGNSSHVIGFEERRRFSRAAMARAVETRQRIEKSGIACPLVTGGSTGTYNIDSEIDGITEIQPGSFMFMDLDYNRIGGAGGPVYRDFQNALTVLTTVISKPAKDNAIVDGGFKAFSTDKPFPPEAKGLTGVSYAWAGDEHGKLTAAGGGPVPVELGDRVEFIVPHCDPTVNLYDFIQVMKGDAVVAVWPITARGRSQ
ncbi:MAG: DSD1 family PLP-dependent enzyme [Acidobacteria bacterium]|nr:DSD1 family PLP-dependent enzyme [Acidobacteriota bacterium]